MDLWMWILVGIFVYWVAVVILGRMGVLPESVNTTGPITTIRTKRGREFLDRLAQRRRWWRAWANIGVGIAIVVMIGSFVMLLVSAILSALSPTPDQIQQPQNVLVIPGVNEFLPLEVAPEIIVGLVIGLVVHEGAHGLLCRVEHIDIKSMGVALIAFIPLGAFVEPDEESASEVSRGARTRMFAAGVTGNFVVTIIVFALLFGPVAGAIAVAPGAAVGGVLPGSAADQAGIDSGDRITAIEGQAIEDFDELSAKLDDIGERTVTVEVNDDETKSVERSLLVTAISPGPSDIPEGSTILSVNGEEVHTMPAFEDLLAERDMATLTYRTPDGESRSTTIPIGSYAIVTDGPLAEAGVEELSEVVITSIASEPIKSTADLQDVLADQTPGSTVPVSYIVNNETHTVDVTLGEGADGGGFLGVRTTQGVTGMIISDFGIRAFPADRYLALIGGGDPDDDPIGVADSFLGKMVIAVFLPLASIVLGSVLPFNFPGFTGDTMNFFVIEGPLAMLGSGTFLLANILFWTGWINLNLGFFNCIPAIPLDGGHILRSATESILSRSPIGASNRVVAVIVTAVALVMLASFLILIFGAGLLAP